MPQSKLMSSSSFAAGGETEEQTCSSRTSGRADEKLKSGVPGEQTQLTPESVGHTQAAFGSLCHSASPQLMLAVSPSVAAGTRCLSRHPPDCLSPWFSLTHVLSSRRQSFPGGLLAKTK